jgi:hypothetical protein
MIIPQFLMYASAVIGSVLLIENSTKIKSTFKQKENKQVISAIVLNPNAANIEANVLTKSQDFKNYCKRNKMDTTIGIMINMRLPSYGYRIFLVNLKTGRIINKGLVAHGSGSGSYAVPSSFSNVENSLATSLGKYKIGERYFGKFGLAYKLHGQEASNNNAYNRAVVLHAHDCVPSEEVTYPICLSWGCPTIAPSFLENLDAVLMNKKKPVGLWIYN